MKKVKVNVNLEFEVKDNFDINDSYEIVFGATTNYRDSEVYIQNLSFKEYQTSNRILTDSIIVNKIYEEESNNN